MKIIIMNMFSNLKTVDPNMNLSQVFSRSSYLLCKTYYTTQYILLSTFSCLQFIMKVVLK